MPFAADPRLARLEDIAAYLSEMRQAAEIIAARQRGNLRRADVAELERLRTAHDAAVALLREERACRR